MSLRNRARGGVSAVGHAYGAIPELLGVLSRSPHPDAVAEAIVEGPGSGFEAVSGAVLWAHGSNLVIIGSHGYRAEEADGLQILPLSGGYPLFTAFFEGEVIIVSSRDMEVQFPALRRPGSRWHHLMKRLPEGVHIHAPIVSDGRSIGAYVVSCQRDRAWSTLDIARLDAVSHALGIWLSHPDSGFPVDADDLDHENPLSERQRRILALVGDGRTNASIAHALGISPSTVKQEIGRAMELLDVTDRHAARRRAADLGYLVGGQG